MMKCIKCTAGVLLGGIIMLLYPAIALADYYGYWKRCETCPLHGPACWDTGTLPNLCGINAIAAPTGVVNVDFREVKLGVFSGAELKEAQRYYPNDIVGPVEQLADGNLYEVNKAGGKIYLSRAVSGEFHGGDFDVQGALEARAELEAQAKEATKKFLGLNWALGIGVASDLSSGARVEKASVVNGVVRVEEESNTQPRIFLEIHMFGLGKLMKNESWEDTTPKPLFGQGPWVGIQSSKDEVVDSFGLGWMWGWRKSGTSTNSFNIGIGLVLDPKVQVLGEGIRANEPLPRDETAIRFKKESRVSGVILTSFTF